MLGSMLGSPYFGKLPNGALCQETKLVGLATSWTFLPFGKVVT